MNANKYDFVIVNLKVIAQVPRNRRLRTNANGNFTLEDNHLLVPIRRKIYGEGRDKLIRDIKSLLLEIQSQIRLLLSSKHLEIAKSGESSRGHARDSNRDDGKDTRDARDDVTKGSRFISDEKRAVMDQISTIHRELERSVTGFESLKATYSADILMVGELEHVIDTVRLYTNEIEQKVPDVAENALVVTLEKES